MKLEYKPISSGSRLFLEIDGKFTNSAETLDLKVQKFSDEYEVFRFDNKTFSELAAEHMERRKWNSTIFKDRTLLDDSTHNRIVHKKDKKWKFEVIIAICVGLELSLKATKNLLESAGHAFGTSKNYQAYKFLFTEFRGWPIDECNDFLEKLNLPPLGNRPRKSKNGM